MNKTMDRRALIALEGIDESLRRMARLQEGMFEIQQQIHRNQALEKVRAKNQEANQALKGIGCPVCGKSEAFWDVCEREDCP